MKAGDFSLCCVSFCIILLLLCGVNPSHSQEITNCLCANSTDLNPKIILICDNKIINLHQYRPCYLDVFKHGAAQSVDSLRPRDFCSGSTLDPRIPQAFTGLTNYTISNYGLVNLTANDLRFEHLIELQAIYNNIANISAGLFQYAPHLQKIYLNFNNISIVEAGAFSELTELRLLDLSDNPLRRFDGKTFIPLEFRCNLAITWEIIDDFDISHTDSAYEIGFDDLGNDDLIIQKSELGPNNTLQNVTIFYTRDQFNHLKTFNSSGTPIRDVVKLIEILGPQLRKLDVSSSFIGQWNASFFDRFFYLNHLKLSHTNLTSAASQQFHRFNNLERFDASHNQMTSIPLGQLMHTPNLWKIDLSFNRIKTLNANDFSEIRDGATINLRNNPLQHIDGKIFLPLYFRMNAVDITWDNVEVLDISQMIGEFDFSYDFNGFAYGKRVKTLLKNLPNDVWTMRFKYHKKDHFKNLKVFNASGTPVKDILKVIELFGPSIEGLDLSSNSIGQFDGNVFDRFMHLKYLNLRRTNLTSFDFNEFNNRAELIVLDVSHNNLNRINFTPHAGSFKELKTLNMIGNKLEEIDFVARWNFPKLTSIGISKNNFTCDYLKEYKRRWPDLKWHDTDSSLKVHERGIDCHQPTTKV